ncbi:hypothetical protein MUN89_17185 [Halobacillus salinarum]|uniref:Spore coat protein n=1 Tax=Halobacillus salinarum TaxID=2932257 RepID=A0ABY4EJD0_9BACI|nr:hypothetical protein [Halobacillus salinarum]UOQ43622.1 hypothetical protein MUN89_17185 [Halobacillus salinarum]
MDQFQYQYPYHQDFYYVDEERQFHGPGYEGEDSRFFGLPFVGGFLGGFLGSAIARPPIYGYGGFGYGGFGYPYGGFGYPGYFW